MQTLINGQKMSTLFKWYAIYTKPRWEKKVSDLLTQKNIENYCPLQRVQRQWSDRKKTILEPLFKSYVFVHILQQGKVPVLETDGVFNFVHWLGKPAVIRDEEIDMMKRFLNDRTNVQVQKCELKINDTVRIMSGPFLYQQGNVIEIKKNTIKLILPSIGFQLVAEISTTDFELVANHTIIGATP
jgi:transcription antitermination factor NusG